MSTWFLILTQFAVIAYALVGGVFLAFSDFIMRSLAHTGGVGGVEAMRIVNREVFRWIFMTLFLGLAPVSLVVAGYGIMNLAVPGSVMIAVAGLIYLVGCFGVTIAFNVPMNETLAKLELGSSAIRDYWVGTYLPRWTLWNTVRSSACAASALLLLFGLMWMMQAQAR